jgi:hypothetical protein
LQLEPAQTRELHHRKLGQKMKRRKRVSFLVIIKTNYNKKKNQFWKQTRWRPVGSQGLLYEALNVLHATPCQFKNVIKRLLVCLEQLPFVVGELLNTLFVELESI